MPVYTVKQGDYVAQVAWKSGFRNYLTVYNDGANAAFRAKRPNPDILFPGDELTIPDPQQRSEAAPTAARHVFYTRPRSLVKLRIIVKDHAFVPLGGKRYTLKAGKDVIGARGDKRTGGDGLIEHDLEPSITRAELQVFVDDASSDGPSWGLEIGHLDPITEVSGVKGRLNNLGFDCGRVDGKIDALTVEALKAFRAAVGITVAPGAEGTIDEPTRARIRQEHQS